MRDETDQDTVELALNGGANFPSAFLTIFHQGFVNLLIGTQSRHFADNHYDYPRLPDARVQATKV